MNTCSQVWVVQWEFLFGFQEQIGQFIGSILTIWSLTTDGNCFPVCITFVECTTGYGHVQVDELSHSNPHAFQYFHSLFVCQFTSFFVSFVVWIQILVHTTIGYDCTSFLLQTGEQLGEPLALYSFTEVTSWVFWYPTATSCDVYHFLFTYRIGAFFSFFFIQISVTVCPQYDSIAQNYDCFIERFLVYVVQRIKWI